MAGSQFQMNENNRVIKSTSRLSKRKKEVCQNEGITPHVHENKLDTNLTWVKFAANPSCLRSMSYLYLQSPDNIERNGDSRWTGPREKEAIGRVPGAKFRSQESPRDCRSGMAVL